MTPESPLTEQMKASLKADLLAIDTMFNNLDRKIAHMKERVAECLEVIE